MSQEVPSSPVSVQYTLTASAAALSGILNSGPVPPKRLTVKNAEGAANNVYLGGSNVTNTPANAGVILGAGDSYTYENQGPAEVFIVGTVNAANIAFIVAEW